jgi:hypothetical protein
MTPASSGVPGSGTGVGDLHPPGEHQPSARAVKGSKILWPGPLAHLHTSMPPGEYQVAARPSGDIANGMRNQQKIEGSKKTAMRRLNEAKGLGISELVSWIHRCRSRLGAEKYLYEPAGYVQLSWRIRAKKPEHFYACKTET